MKPSQITRRSFVRHLAVAGAAATAVPQIVPATVLGKNPPSSRLNIGLLACGGRMRQLLPLILYAGENVTAICDVDARQVPVLIKDAARHGPGGPSVAKAKVYEDYRKLLDAEKSVDAVFIAAGQRWHVPMSKRVMQAGKHVYCEKPLAHSAAEAREIRELAKQSKLVTQVGSQGGATDTFRRSMEVIQAGVLGPIREVHAWITRGAGPSSPIDTHADAIPAGLNWDFWCGPSKLLPFKNHYLGPIAAGNIFCLNWGMWLEFGDGHVADMGAHGLNLPWRALKLGAPHTASAKFPEPLKDSYPSANDFRWEFAARGDMPPVTLWWHDGYKAGPPAELGEELLSTYGKIRDNGVLFAGEKGILFSDAWGVGGVVKLKDEQKCRGVKDHPECKPVPVTLPRAKNQDPVAEFLDACKGGPKTFQGLETAANVAEIAMVGMVALHFDRPIEWDSEALKVKGEAEADRYIHRPHRKKWL